MSVWKILVSSWMILFVVSPLRNGDRSCGSFTAEEISSRAAMILSSKDVFGMVYFVGENSIVSETRSPPVSDTGTSKY